MECVTVRVWSRRSVPRRTRFLRWRRRHDVGAAYVFHLAESQGFLDGNKRTAIACAATFLVGNGCVDRAHDLELYDAMIALSARRMDKAGLAAVLREQFPRAAGG